MASRRHKSFIFKVVALSLLFAGIWATGKIFAQGRQLFVSEAVIEKVYQEVSQNQTTPGCIHDMGKGHRRTL